MAYRDLDPRTELEQIVTADLEAALTKRQAKVRHWGKPGSNAPASAPCDITVVYNVGDVEYTLMVEVAQRRDASEFQSIVSHLDAFVEKFGGNVNLLYSANSTSTRMARLLRNENERRATSGRPGRFLFLKFEDFEQILHHWKELPSDEAGLHLFQNIPSRWQECTDDLTSARVFQREIFPTWTSKAISIDLEQEQRLAAQQERLKRDIVKLENQLRAIGVTGQRAHKYLIYLFFMALYEDKRGAMTRATKETFIQYRDGMSNADRDDPRFKNKTVHHLLQQQILAASDIRAAGIQNQYEAIDLPDEFVVEKIIPIFESYSFADASIDAIGAVFEALARRAEKDNRIGQFFTPETAVTAATRLAGLRATDIVTDPACGTGRFLIRAMTTMIPLAGSVMGKSRAQVEAHIRQHQLLGCDIDPWVSVIAKMNMYIHGDGKSNIKKANGLTLSTSPVFKTHVEKKNKDYIDVVLTNPPLGDINFGSVAEEVARAEREENGLDADEISIKVRAGEWSSMLFDVIPHTVKENDERLRAVEKEKSYIEQALIAKLANYPLKESRANRHLKEWQAKRQAAERALGDGKLTYVAAGSTAKGGALFISALVASIKDVRDASLPYEWRGGVLSLIIDESVLNTREHSAAREFIRKHFFVKAIVSLPRDAFADLAKTTAKTSILLLVKKGDVAVLQREPVFFARAIDAGPTGKQITRRNDLVPICDFFDSWRKSVIDLSNANERVISSGEADQIRQQIVHSLSSYVQFSINYLNTEEQGQRLDEAFWCMKSLVGAMATKTTLNDVVDLVSKGREPPPRDLYRFASVSRLNVNVIIRPLSATRYENHELQTVQKGDILASGIDLVFGSVAVAGKESTDAVVSKEYFILRAKSDVEPLWVVAILRTPAVRRILEGIITGTSNRTRVESPSMLMDLPIPSPPSIAVQKSIAKKLKESQKHLQSMKACIERAEKMAIEAGGFDPLIVGEFVEVDEEGNLS